MVLVLVLKPLLMKEPLRGVKLLLRKEPLRWVKPFLTKEPLRGVKPWLMLRPSLLSRPQPKCPAESEESSWEPAARPVEKPDGLAPVVEVVSPGRELRPRVLL